MFCVYDIGGHLGDRQCAQVIAAGAKSAVAKGVDADLEQRAGGDAAGFRRVLQHPPPGQEEGCRDVQPDQLVDHGMVAVGTDPTPVQLLDHGRG